MFKSNFLILLIISSFFSCNEKKDDILEIIKVNVENKYPRGNFEDYFSSSTIIPLETNNNSIISNIDRVSVSNEKIFILDKRLKSVIIFDSKGNFLNKIKNTGNGPGEYGDLIDFSIDPDRKQLILLTNGSKKVFVYGFDGEYIKEIKMKKSKGFYPNISYVNNKFLFLNKGKGMLFHEYNIQSKKMTKSINMNKYDEFYSHFGSRFPYFIKSNNNINISSLYSDLIYGYNNGNFYPKYRIDFGEQKAPLNMITKLDNNYTGIYKYIKDNKYGFGISNFRESTNYITFNFWHNMIVIYSKKSKEAKAFSSFNSPIDQFYFSEYTAHDGNDDNIISIYRADAFKNQMYYFKENANKWMKIPNYIKEFDKKVESTDNPLLIIYSFKK